MTRKVSDLAFADSLSTLTASVWGRSRRLVPFTLKRISPFCIWRKQDAWVNTPVMKVYNCWFKTINKFATCKTLQRIWLEQRSDMACAPGVHKLYTMQHKSWHCHRPDDVNAFIRSIETLQEWKGMLAVSRVHFSRMQHCVNNITRVHTRTLSNDSPQGNKAIKFLFV